LSRGFTLLEVLVAVAIFAILGTMAMTGYTQIAQQRDRLAASMERARAVQLAIMRITQDFAELEPRSVRDALGGNSEPALIADTRGPAAVRLTRAGWSNPAGIGRSTLQRVEYRVLEGKLIRDHYGVLDRTLTTEPVSVPLVDQVLSFRLRFMDNGRSWSDQWPSAAAQRNSVGVPQALAPVESPVAVEVTLELEDWGRIVRLIEVPG
jgi:general secretion pathway protein J